MRMVFSIPFYELKTGAFKSRQQQQRLMKARWWRWWRWPWSPPQTALSDLLLKVQRARKENHKASVKTLGKSWFSFILVNYSPCDLWRAVCCVPKWRAWMDLSKGIFTFPSQRPFVCLMILLAFVLHTNDTLTSVSQRCGALELISGKK